jgi:hypothetical protein
MGEVRPAVHHVLYHDACPFTDRLSARDGGADEGLAGGRELCQLANCGDT